MQVRRINGCLFNIWSNHREGLIYYGLHLCYSGDAYSYAREKRILDACVIMSNCNNEMKKGERALSHHKQKTKRVTDDVSLVMYVAMKNGTKL